MSNKKTSHNELTIALLGNDWEKKINDPRIKFNKVSVGMKKENVADIVTIDMINKTVILGDLYGEDLQEAIIDKHYKLILSKKLGEGKLTVSSITSSKKSEFMDEIDDYHQRLFLKTMKHTPKEK